MESINIVEPLDLLKQVFIISGLWNVESSWKPLGILHFILIQGVFCVGFWICTVVNLMKGEVFEGLYNALAASSLVIRIFNFMIKQKKFMTYVDHLRSPLLEPRTIEERALFRDRLSSFVKLCRPFVATTYATVISGSLIAIVSGHKRLPFPAWYPFDWRNNNMHFWIAFTYQTLAASIASAIHGIFDLAHGYLFLQIAVFYRLISMRLQAIGHKRFADGVLVAPENAIKDLKDCIRMHQCVNKLADCAEDIWTVPIAVQICISGTVICLAAFYLTELSPINDSFLFFFNFFFLGTMVIEISLPCYYGNEVTYESQLVATALYSSNWTEMPREYKQLLICFMEALKRPKQLTAGGYFRIGLDTLVSVLQNAYSLFALLKSIKN